MLVRNCCKGDVCCEWTKQIFRGWHTATPGRIDMALNIRDWSRPPQDTPRQFWWRSVERGDWANNRLVLCLFLQHGRIACNAEHCNTYSNSVVYLSVSPSVTRWYPIQTNKHRIMRSSLWGSKNTSFLIPTIVGGDVAFHLKFALKITHPLRNAPTSTNICL